MGFFVPLFDINCTRAIRWDLKISNDSDEKNLRFSILHKYTGLTFRNAAGKIQI